MNRLIEAPPSELTHRLPASPTDESGVSFSLRQETRRVQRGEAPGRGSSDLGHKGCPGSEGGHLQQDLAEAWKQTARQGAHEVLSLPAPASS